MSRLALAALLIAAADPRLAAADPDGPAARVRKALDQPGTLVTPNPMTPVDFAEFVRARAGVEVRVDVPALQAAGIDPAQPVFAARMREGKYRDGLRDALAPYHLRFGIVGGEVVISTDEGIIRRQLRQRVSVEYAGTPLGAVLRKLAADTGANIVLDPRQEEQAGRAAVKLTLDDVPLETAVRLAAEVAGFRTVRMSNVLYVTTDDRAEKLRPDADGPVPPTPVPVVEVIPVVAPPAVRKEEK